MAQSKHHFDFAEGAELLDSPARQARSLEYIAHYLELIEGHLAKLAVEGPSFGQIGQALTELARQGGKK